MSERKNPLSGFLWQRGYCLQSPDTGSLVCGIGQKDFLRPYLVWAVYMLLLLRWQYTITTKITQKAMHCHLTAQNIVSILYLTVRFIQDAFLYVNIPWMRFTGYFINIAAIFHPTVRSLRLILSWQGRRLSDQQKWYLLLIPACLSSVLALTNDLHHFSITLCRRNPSQICIFTPTSEHISSIFGDLVSSVIRYM